MYLSFYIAWRYFFSRFNAKVVNLISLIASLALSISTIALIVILSIFEGLKSLNINLYENINPDIKISALKGKELYLNEGVIEKILQIEEIEALSKTLEEKIYLNYRGKNHLSYIKGVDNSYHKVIDLEKSIYLGQSHLKNINSKSIIVGLEIAQRLNLQLEDDKFPIEVFIPSPGKGFIDEKSIQKTQTIASGIFHLSEEMDQSYIYSSLSFMQDLIRKKDKFYNLEIKAKENTNLNKIKDKIENILGKKVTIKTRAEQQEALFKMINTENLIIYLLLSLVSLITAFNLVGTLIILKLDKKNQIHLLWALGSKTHQIKNVFFSLGLLITLISWISGTFIGCLVIFFQKKYHWLKLDRNVPFPVELTFTNFLISSLTILIIGIIISYLSSRKLPLRHIK